MGYNGSVQGSSLPYQFHIPDATDNTSGTMSAADKTKLDGIPAGGAGPAGVNAFTATTASFVQPAVSSTVIAEVAESSWAVVGQVVYVANGGYYTVSAVPDSTHITLTNLGYDGSASPGASVASASGVTPGGLIGETGATGSTFATGGICSLGANETFYSSGSTYGIGVAGYASDPGTAAPFLLGAQVTPVQISFFSAIAPAMGQSITARIFYSPDQGATESQLGSNMTLTAGQKYVAQALPGTVVLPIGSYLKVAINVSSGSLNTTLTTSVR